MYRDNKDYYLKEGRLDLSLLEDSYVEVKQEVSKQREEAIEYAQEKKYDFLGVYKDSQIENILKEMGNYFSAI